MNGGRIAGTSHPTLEKKAEAAAWLARLRGPQRSAQIERGFQRWLRADAEHARAFELLTERLEVVERLRGRSLHRRSHHPGRSSHTGWIAAMGIAAALVAVVAGAFLYVRSMGVATQVGEQRTLTLADGSRLYLNTDTRVVARLDNERRIVELKQGEALFEVAKDGRRPFMVVAGDRTVKALGTSFIVRRDTDRMTVTLIEGKIAVSGASEHSSTDRDASGRRNDEVVSSDTAPGPGAVLLPGQRLMLDAKGRTRLDQPSLDKVMAWRYGQVALENMPLSEAVFEMNRYSTVRLVVERTEAWDLRVGGFFRMGDSASFARAVASTYGFEVIEESGEIRLAGLPKITAR